MLILVIITVVAVGGSATAQGNSPEPAYLVLSVDEGADAVVSRNGWDVAAWSPLMPGASLRLGEYVQLSGRTTIVVLCSDLTVLEQRSSEAPRCNRYPEFDAFVYLDDPTWIPDTTPAPVNVISTDPATFPEVVSAQNLNLVPLSGDKAAEVEQRVSAILDLDVPDEAKVFALGSYYRAEGMLIDALGALTAMPSLECTAQRPTVELPAADERTLTQSPVLYLRLGELYQMIGQIEDAARNYDCAITLAEGLSDPADAGLAYARRATLSTDPAEALQFYQQAINYYVTLGAVDSANEVLEICGSRNCTLPSS
jgi:tetratricopeptide (TPR) repeat protein